MRSFVSLTAFFYGFNCASFVRSTVRSVLRFQLCAFFCALCCAFSTVCLLLCAQLCAVMRSSVRSVARSAVLSLCVQSVRSKENYFDHSHLKFHYQNLLKVVIYIPQK